MYICLCVCVFPCLIELRNFFCYQNFSYVCVIAIQMSDLIYSHDDKNSYNSAKNNKKENYIRNNYF